MTYDLIYLDPPWTFDHWGEGGNERSADQHYTTMTREELLALDVAGIASPDSYLVMWCSWPYLQQGLELITAWGFVYKTALLEWVKLNPSGMGFHMGMGYYTRANMEFCLLGKRGNPPGVEDHGVRKTIVSPVMEHSQKPWEAHRRIATLWPSLSKVELFATQHSATGAHRWGFYPVGYDLGDDVRDFIRRESSNTGGGPSDHWRSSPWLSRFRAALCRLLSSVGLSPARD